MLISKKLFLTLRKYRMSVGRVDDILQSLEIKQKQKRKHQLVKLKKRIRKYIQDSVLKK